MASQHQNKVNTALSPWVVRFAPLISGAVLDVACGSGRHTRFFLARGHPVTAIDRDFSRLADLRGHDRLALQQVDLEADSQKDQLPPESHGGVVVTNYLWRPLLPAIVAAVADEGVLVYETFAVGNEAYGKPSNPDYLLRPGELLDAVGGQLEVVAYEHGIIEAPRPAVVQRICAVRRSAPQPV